MALTLVDVIEKILRDCVASVRPWRPEQMQRPENLSLAQVEKIARQMTEMKLLEVDRHEAGYRATTQARLLLEDERALHRFRRDLEEATRPARPVWELPANPTPQQQLVYDTLHSPIKPLCTRILIGCNVAVFLLGLVLAARSSEANAFFFGQPTTGSQTALRETGAMALPFPPLEHGGRLAWVQVLTACFVHMGIMHLGMNMYALHILGRDTEWLWGRWRFLVIYLFAGLGGSCLGIYANTSVAGGDNPPSLSAGASGAICGLLAAEAVWLLLNRSCLPPKMFSAQIRAIGFNALIITAISIAPYWLTGVRVGAAAHLGGAIGGAVAAFLLHGHRFGRSPIKWICLAALLPVAVAMFVPLRPWSPDAPVYLINVRSVDSLAHGVYRQPKGLADLLTTDPARRDHDEVTAYLDGLPPLIEELERASRQLEKPEGAPADFTDKDRQEAQIYFTKMASIFSQMEAALRDQKPWAKTQEAERIIVFNSRPKCLEPKK